MQFRLGCLFFTQVKICNFLDIKLPLRRKPFITTDYETLYSFFIMLSAPLYYGLSPCHEVGAARCDL